MQRQPHTEPVKKALRLAGFVYRLYYWGHIAPWRAKIWLDRIAVRVDRECEDISAVELISKAYACIR